MRAEEHVRGDVRSGVSEAADEMRSKARASGMLQVVHDDSRDWVAALRGPRTLREQAVADLHSLLLRGARFELTRRRALLADLPPGEHDRLATEAANDALLAIHAKLDSFRGAGRFTTWAYKFVLMEAGAAAQRKAWHGREIDLAVTLPETLGALRDALAETLTPHERQVFVALALNHVPIDVLAERLGTTRSALYATLRDARGTLRAATSRHSADLSHTD